MCVGVGVCVWVCEWMCMHVHVCCACVCAALDREVKEGIEIELEGVELKSSATGLSVGFE